MDEKSEEVKLSSCVDDAPEIVRPSIMTKQRHAKCFNLLFDKLESFLVNDPIENVLLTSIFSRFLSIPDSVPKSMSFRSVLVNQYLKESF